MVRVRFHFVALLALAAVTAHAARPMLTDDARTVDAKACQVETWVRHAPDNNQHWALPACNFTGNLELTMGGARTHDGDGHRQTDFVIQGKTLFKKLEPNGWSIGLAVGNLSHPNVSRKLRGDIYAYIPASFSFRDDR